MREQLIQLADTISKIGASLSEHQQVDIIGDFGSLIDETLVLSEFAQAELQTGSTDRLAIAYEGVAVASSAIKDLALLARDTQIQRIKAHVLVADDIYSTTQQQDLIKKGDDVLAGACTDTAESISKLVSLDNTNPSHQEIIDRSRIVLAPHAVIAAQLSTIKTQLTDLYLQQPLIDDVQQSLISIRGLLLDRLDHEVGEYSMLTTHIAAILKMLDDSTLHHALIDTIDKTIEKLGRVDNNGITDEAKRQIDQLPTITLTIGTDQGRAIRRETNLKSALKSWMDVQYISHIMEMTESSSQLHTRTTMALHNMKNRLSLQDKIPDSEVIDDIKHALSGLQRDISKVQSLIDNNGQILLQLITDEVRLSKLYQGGDFLQLGLQGSITQVIQSQNQRVSSLTTWLKEQWQHIQVAAQEWRYPTRLSRREAVAKCLSTRQINATTEIYDQVFQNTDFISEVFLVKRENEIKQIDKAIQRWRSGAHTLIAITGSPLSGKTTFINYVKNSRFGRHAITLTPGQDIKINGSIISIGHDLKAALDKIHKVSVAGQTLIAIDDLEMWHDEQHSVLTNVSELLAYTAKHSDKILVVMAMGRYLYDKLNTYISIQDHVYSTVELSKCTMAEAIKTINVRHAATHKVLTDQQGEHLSQSQMLSTVRQIYSDAHGCIGDILRRWTYATQEVMDNEVTFYYEHETLPEIIDDHRSMVLSQILLHKSMTYSELIYSFGRELYESVRPTIGRLTNDHILVRDSQDRLHINPALIHDIEQQMRPDLQYRTNYQKTNII